MTPDGTDASVGTKNMTTEEIITTLRTAQAEVEWEYPMDYAAAIDEAIEAVYVRDELEKIKADEAVCVGITTFGADLLLKAVKEKALQKNYWIASGLLLKCPKCGRYHEHADNYCSHCGAKMEGIREE